MYTMYHGRALADMMVVVMSVMHGIVDMNIVTTVGTTVALYLWLVRIDISDRSHWRTL